MSKEETFPFPQKYIDVTRTAFITGESRIEDFWNVDSRLTQSPTTTILDSVWPEFRSGMSESAQKKKEKQEWAIEQQIDNARRLGGVFFIDPENCEFKETSKLGEKVGDSFGGGNPLQKKEETLEETAGNRKRW